MPNVAYLECTIVVRLRRNNRLLVIQDPNFLVLRSTIGDAFDFVNFCRLSYAWNKSDFPADGSFSSISVISAFHFQSQFSKRIFF